MKLYIKAVTNISDLEAKIAKKKADKDKKLAWIDKKEANIVKKLDLLSTVLDSATYDRLVAYLEYLKNNRDYRIPEDIYVNTWQIARAGGWSYDSKEGKALYSIDDDAKSIYNSKEAIKEIDQVIDNYESKIATIRSKDSEIDRIPDCLKDFMNDIVARWDEYDIDLRDKSRPYYRELQEKADEILYEGNPTRSYMESDNKLKAMYPNIERSWNRTKAFEEEYIYAPFRKAMGQSVQYCSSLWDMSDDKIHAENEKAGKQLILDLLKRVTKITGPVTDWSGLYVTQGNMGAVLNGVVIGEDANARVESIVASGPVQRPHIRTLVKPVRS